MRVIILLADGFEEIEALGTAEILRRAKVEIILVGLLSNVVQSAQKITVIADKTLSSINTE